MRRLQFTAHMLFLAMPVTFCSMRPGVAQIPAEGIDQASHLVVMIEGQLGGELTTGAGIIFGAQGDRLYIATANHVVRRGQEEAQDLTVQLRSLPGELVPAKLLRHFDRGLDLAVLSVQGWEELGLSIDALPFDRLGDASVLERGDPVYSLGYPEGEPWQVNATAEVFFEQRGDLLYFESDFIAGGSSGGGLFNSNSELLGMIRADQPPKGIAVSLNRLLETLGDWGYPVSFRTAAGISGTWITDNGWIFEFKVLGEELFGKICCKSYNVLGILGGKVSRDKVSFYTLERFSTSEKIGENDQGVDVTAWREKEVRIQYRGILAGDEIAFIMQRDDGLPPREFAVRRMPAIHGWFGVQSQNIDRSLADSLGLEQAAGELIVDVVRASPADEAGLNVKDVILEYNGVLLEYEWQWPALVAGTPVGEEVTLEILRQGEPRTVRVTVQERPDG